MFDALKEAAEESHKMVKIHQSKIAKSTKRLKQFWIQPTQQVLI